MKDNCFRIYGFLSPFLIPRLSAITLFLLAFSVLPAFAGEDIQQIGDESPRQMIKRADKLTRKGNLAEAEKVLRRAVAVAPAESLPKLKLAHLLFKQRQLNAAYEMAFEVAKVEPKNSYAFAILGITLLNAGNFKQAEIAIVNALNLNRREALAWAGLGMLDFYENRIAASLENLNEAVYLESDEPDYVFAFAQVSARAERYREAADAYRRYLVISSDTDNDRRDRIKGLINFLSYLGNKQSLYILDGHDSTSVNFTLVGNRPIIELKVNGKNRPLRFVLDTGSGISVISEETAEKLNIGSVARGGLARGIGGNGKFQIVYGFLRSVEIGDVKIKNVPVYIRKFHTNGEIIDGYIGLSLISKFLTTIDYGDQTFSLIKKDSLQKKADEKESLSLPLRLTSSGFLSGEVQLEGVESRLNFIVDTGASVSVISNELASLREISQFARSEKMRVVGAAGVTEDVPAYLLPRVTFGNHTRESIVAVMLDLNLINETSGFEQAGILGGNFLRNYRLTFDFENSKVIFVPINK